MSNSIWVGYDGREAEAFAVLRHSIERHSGNVPVHALVLDDLRDAGLYTRPTSKRDGKLWDDISEAPMSTEFAISRFMTPLLAKRGWALFIDCDMLARRDLADLFALADDSKAVMCVKHPNYIPPEKMKMDGQMQTLYLRKNWSSAVLYNCAHPANQRLTMAMINEVPGRDLHRFCWLDDSEIGGLPPEWNYLVNVSNRAIEPALVHWTAGGPWFEDYHDVPYAEEWRAERGAWLHGWHRVMPKWANGQGESAIY